MYMRVIEYEIHVMIFTQNLSHGWTLFFFLFELFILEFRDFSGGLFKTKIIRHHDLYTKILAIKNWLLRHFQRTW